MGAMLLMYAAAMVGLLSNPQTRGRYEHITAEHKAKHPKDAVPTFAQWVASEAKAHAEAIRATEED